MPLYERDRGFEQVGKKKGQQQNEESATRPVEDNGRDGEERHGRDNVPGTIVE